MPTPVIDPFSGVPLYLKARYQGELLSVATGFTYQFEDGLFLITNWHVASGRNPATGQALQTRTGSVPDRIVVILHVDGPLGRWQAHEVLLNDTDTGEPTWYQHPTHGQQVDVAAIPLICPVGLKSYPLNDQTFHEDMQVKIGQDVFVTGFPLGIRAGGVLPVWKRASIASEPEISLDALPKMLVDTATREGMSGSPVLLRTWGSYSSTGGSISMTGGSNTKFIGIYSGRIGAEEDFKAQLGIVWRAEVIEEILRERAQGSWQISPPRAR